MNRELRRRKRNADKQNRAINQWLKANEQLLGIEDVGATWENIKQDMAPKLLEVAVRYLATMEAGQIVNDTFEQRLKMPGAGIDLDDFRKTVENAFAVELTSIILRDSQIPKTQQQEILSNVVVRAFPMPEGASGVKDLAEILRQVNKLGKHNEPLYGKIQDSRSSPPKDAAPPRPNPFRPQRKTRKTGQSQDSDDF